MVLPYSRVVLLSFGIVPWCMWHLHLLCPYCTTTPAQLIVICLVLLLPLCHVGSIWWSCLRYMWILCPLAPSHGICGMSTSADLCIPCHILIVLWIIMAVVLWTRVIYISYGTVSWCPLHFCHTCSFHPITLSAFGRIKWFCHIHVWFYYHLASSHGVCGISIFFVHIAPPPLLFASFVTPPLDGCYIYL